MTRLQALKRRKLVQWALAYLAGAFVALQLVDMLADRYAWPSNLFSLAIILVGLGSWSPRFWRGTTVSRVASEFPEPKR